MATGYGSDWAQEEFGGAALGDARLTKRLVGLAAQTASRPHCSFPHALSPADLKAACRFFDNPAVDTDGMLAGHLVQTLQRMETLPVVLAVQDTTEFNLTHLPATEGLDYCGSKFTRGFMLHSTLAVSLEGLPIGGYLNSKHDRPPGATVLWRGFHALHEISSMYLIMRKNE